MLRSTLDSQVKLSTAHERWLDSAISQMQQSLRDLADEEKSAELAFVSHDDVRAIESFATDTVIAIKAPSGTTLEVPDPDEGMEYPQRRYQIYLKSISGPVEVFLVSPTEGEEGGVDTPVLGAFPDTSSLEQAVAVRSSCRASDEHAGSHDIHSTAVSDGVESSACAASHDADAAGGRRKRSRAEMKPPQGGDDFWAGSSGVGVHDLFSEPVKDETGSLVISEG
jgi:hypothetical protein